MRCENLVRLEWEQVPDGEAEPSISLLIGAAERGDKAATEALEIAVLRDCSERTVQRSWERARLYLHRTIRADLPA